MRRLSIARSAGCDATPKQRYRLRRRRLVVVAEVAQALERVFQTAVGGHREGIETALPQVIELIAKHVADRAQLTVESQLLAQQARGRITAAVGELRKMQRNKRQR